MTGRKTIGILGGLGPESTIEYYAQITREYHRRRGDYAYPHILINSLSFQEIIDAKYETAEKVLAAIEALAGAGADFVVAACNSIHTVYEQVAPQAPVPWVSIMSSTSEAIRSAGIEKVALLGTKVTMTADFYPRALAGDGIDCIVPPADQQERINRIIFAELVVGKVTEESRRFVMDCIEQLRRRGAQGVVLGCTELPFLLRPQDSPLPPFDTTKIHAQKALAVALGDEPLST